MKNNIENLWSRLKISLQAVAKNQLAIQPSLVINIINDPNEAFLLRAYLTVNNANLNDEIAICINGQIANDNFNLSSDLCTEDGVLLKDGPSATIPMQFENADFDAAIEIWHERFTAFLSQSELMITEYHREP